MKEKLDRLEVEGFVALASALPDFRFWYNHLRPHQHLQGRTPAEVWAKIDPNAKPVKQEFWFEAWEGLLTGYYLRR